MAPTTLALAAEAAALQSALTGLTEQDFNLPSPCPPWTVGELLCHVVIGAGRVATALAESPGSAGPVDPAPASPADAALTSPADAALTSPADAALTSPADAALTSTAGYYRHDTRFSTTVDADRIETARTLARQLGGPEPVVSELARRCRETVDLLAAAPPDRTITTRHGDRMLLTDFAITRVVELAVHGLDLATGLRRPPWLTVEATGILAELWLPPGRAERLRQQLGWDRAGLIARLAGRVNLTPAEQQLLRDAGARSLALS